MIGKPPYRHFLDRSRIPAYSPSKVLARERRMTVAIGMPFRHGEMKCALICADTQLTTPDWATYTESKVHLRLTDQKEAFGIAYAGENADAAKMLAGDITDALSEADPSQGAREIIETEMTKWFAAYGASAPPVTEFVVAVSRAQACKLFCCSPPNTVNGIWEPFVIGTGRRVVEPLLPGPSVGLPSAHAATMRAVYWMYKAKKHEAQLCGGDTHIFAISDHGGMALFDDDAIAAAEALCAEADKLKDRFLIQLLSGQIDELTSEEGVLEVSSRSLELAAKIRTLKFPGFGYLNAKWGTHQ